MLKVQKNVLLGPYTTFKIGESARYFAEARLDARQAESIDEIQELCQFAKDKNVPVFMLGGGSNILISDKGFKTENIFTTILCIIELTKFD